MAGHEQKNLTIREEDFIKVPFIRIPIRFAGMNDCDLPESMITVYTVISINRSMINQQSNICMKLFCELYGYIRKKNNYYKPKFYNSVIDCLNYFQENGMIKFVDSIDQIDDNDFIRLQITDKFDRCGKYICMRFNEYNRVCEISKKNNISIDLLLKVYTYIMNIINTTSKHMCFINTLTISGELDVNPETTKKIINLFCTETSVYPAIFLKQEHIMSKSAKKYALVKNSKYEEEMRNKEHNNYIAAQTVVEKESEEEKPELQLPVLPSDDPDDFDDIWGDMAE